MEAAAVSLAQGAMGSLLEKLALLLVDEYKLVKGAKRQIKLLQKELEVMNIFLKRISQEEDPEDLYKHQANDVRELSYDIEDSIDEFKLRVERKSNTKPHGFLGFVDRCVNLLTTMKIRHKHAKEFKDLLSRAKEVSEQHKRYDFSGSSISKPNNATIDFDIMTSNGARQRNLSRRNLMALFEEGLVGIDRPRDELIQLMNDEGASTHQLKVLSIVGPGGLGKTTLATQIRDKLKGQFQCRALVSVSQRPNIRRIVRRILEEVGFKCDANANMELWEEAKLISELRNFLSRMRYFIVIDDIWDSKVWETVRYAFPDSIGSRIITTTRIEEVGKACCSNPSYVYKMMPLSDHDSNKLFLQRIFGSEDHPCSQNLEEVSAKILKKCGGLPLAIITISSFLASEPDNEWKWEYVLKYLDSLGSNLELNPKLSKTREILNLSYTHLPDYLKTCMLYLGIYPEDYTIDRDDLVRQWVAQDFVCKAHHVTDPENGANIYFDALINRSMIQPVVIDCNGKVMSCKIHDMMLDLILIKCRDPGLEQNFITVIDKIQDVTGRTDKIRRLSLHMDGAVDYRVIGSDQLSGIRTLARFAVTSGSVLLSKFALGILEFEIPKGSRPSYLPTLEQFRHLRVLTIEILGGSRKSVLLDFTGIYVLYQLRYLKIVADKDPVVLPLKIGALQQLETIHLQTRVIYAAAGGHTFEKLPLDIVHMSGLLHLIIPLWRRLPNGIGNMKSLRTLRYFNLRNNTADNIRGLRELTNLTELEVGCRSSDLLRVLTAVEPLEADAEVAERGKEVLRACLEKLCNLKYLNIDTGPYGACLDVLCSAPASFCHLERFYVRWFSRAPEWIGQLHRLYILNLRVTEVLEEDVAMLAQLRSLIRLNLHIRATPKDEIIVRGTGFSSLKHFIFSCSRISCLTFEAGAMAKLQKLELFFNARGWDMYGAAPTGIEYISSLNEITVKIGGYGANESTRRAAESALRDAGAKHPSRPTVNIKYHNARWVFEESKEEEDAERNGVSIIDEEEDDVPLVAHPRH